MRLLEDLTLPNGTNGREKESSVFDGLDTSLSGLGVLAGLPPGALDANLERMAAAARSVLADPGLLRDPATVVPQLVGGLEATRSARQRVAALTAPAGARAEADFLLGIKQAQFEDALVRAAGLVTDVLADREVAAGGETVRATVSLFVPDGSPVTVGDMQLLAPEGWHVQRAAASDAAVSDNPFGRLAREEPTSSAVFTLTVGPDAAPTQPYWLARPREKEVFAWDVPTALHTLSFAPPEIVGRVSVTIGGAALTVSRGLEYRYADSVRGEIRRAFAVVPAVTLDFDEPLHIVPASDVARPRRMAVRLQNQTLSSASGLVRLAGPAGWTVVPRDAPVHFNASGERQAAWFTVTPASNAAPGAYDLRAEAVFDGRTHGLAQRVIAYPHIQSHRLYAPARATARVLDVRVAPVRVGYVMGAGDQVPEAIRRLGLEVTLLTDDQLASADLAAYDVIVIGIRASEGRPAFVANNGRLLDYARDGGTLIVQYQQPDYVARGLVPFKVEMGRGVARHRRTCAGDSPRSGASRLHVPQSHHRRGLGGLGAGTEPLRVLDDRSRAHAAARDRRSQRTAAARRPGLRPPRQGPVRLHLICVVSPAPRRRAGRLPIVREPPELAESASAVTNYQLRITNYELTTTNYQQGTSPLGRSACGVQDQAACPALCWCAHVRSRLLCFVSSARCRPRR